MTAPCLRALLCLCVALAAAPASGAAPAPRRTSPRATSEPPKITVLLLGDSLVATALGQQLEALLDGLPGVACHRVARSATGLARPDHFDWPTVAAKAAARHRPDLVLILIGSNDGQDLQHARGKGRRPRAVLWGDPAWPAAYRTRAGALLKALGAPRVPVLWLGLPPMRSRSLEQKLAVVRREQRAAVAALGVGHRYLGLRALVQELRDRTPVKARRSLYTRDGVHFSLKGAIRFQRLLEPVLWPWLLRVAAPPLPSPPGSGTSPDRTSAPRSGAAHP